MLPNLGTDYEWNSSSNTLTFKEDFTWKTSAEVAFRITGGDITIEIESGKTVNFESICNSTSGFSRGIEATGNLTITGAGKLNATGGTAGSSKGIDANSIDISGCTVTATGGQAQASYGIIAYGNIAISGGTVIATGGQATNGNSYGIYAVDNLIISGGIVEAQGNSQALVADNGTVTAPTAPYIYWTNTTASATNPTKYNDGNFTNAGQLKYVKLTTQDIYSVNVPNNVTADKKYVQENEQVTLTIAPPAGQQLSTITATDASSASVTLTGTGNTRTFTMPSADVTVTATFVNTTPPEPEPQPEIELEVQPDGLTVRVTNTSEVATGRLTLRLTDNTGDAFILSDKSIDNIAPGEYANITLTLAEGLAEGIYTTVLRASGYNVWAQLHITYTLTPVANEQVEANALRAYVQDGTLHLTGLTPGDQWRLYTITGALTKTAIAEGEETTTALPARGIYIIATAKGTMKVIW